MAYDQQLADAQKEAEHWKHVASYLASCHAATLEGLTKSAPKSHVRRHVTICEKAALYLRGKESPYVYRSRMEEIEWATLRCEKAVASRLNGQPAQPKEN